MAELKDWHGWVTTAEHYFNLGQEERMWRCLLRAAVRLDWLAL